MEVPKSFICPISKNIMSEPVQDPEGNIYEKSEIIKWLKQIQISPITNNYLSDTQLIPNRALKDAIDDFKKTNNDFVITKPFNINNKEKDKTVTISTSKMNIRDKTFLNIELITPNFNDEMEPEPESESVVDSKNEKIGNDIILVIDNSASTSIIAEVKNLEGSSESTNLSLLDLIKHCIKTIVETATEHDRISLIIFNDEAHLKTDLINMDMIGKKIITEEVNKLISTGSTNIADAITLSLKTANENKLDDRISTIMLFTDGIPTISPPGGEINYIKKYLDTFENSSIVNTFGFGTQINKDILIEISKMTGGSFKYISDASMVGTVKINQLANIYSTIANNCLIKIESLNEAKILNIPGNFNVFNSAWGKTINIGSIQYDQNRNIIIEISNNKLENGTPIFNFTFEYQTRYNDKVLCEAIVCYNDDELKIVNLNILDNYIRTLTIDKIFSAYYNTNYAEQIQIIADLISHIESFEINTEFIDAILLDLKDQINLAFTQYFKTWGQYYIPSLMFAYQQEQCHNFRDKAIQLFGGSYFKNLCDDIEDLFLKIPPPKPSSNHHYNRLALSQSSLPPTTSTSTAIYLDRQGGCFTEDTKIKISQNKYKNAGDFKQGDTILTVDKIITKIKTIIKFNINENSYIIKKNNLGITNWHPIRYKNTKEWFYPIKKFEPIKSKYNCVYNFVLQSGNIIYIDEFEAVTLGHNLKDDIVKHNYFGNEIIKDLKKCNGWKNGFIEFNTNCFKRDNKTNEINGIDINFEVIDYI